MAVNHSNWVLISVMVYLTVTLVFWLGFGLVSRRRPDKRDDESHE